MNEDVAYAQHLINAGVPTELFVAPGAYHGFDILAPDVPVSKRFIECWHQAPRNAFSRTKCLQSIAKLPPGQAALLMLGGSRGARSSSILCCWEQAKAMIDLRWSGDADQS